MVLDAVFGDLPFEFDRALQGGLGQVDLHAVPGGLDVADVDEARQRRRPQPGQRAAAGVEGEVVGAVEPARRHHPAVLVVHVPLLRVRVGVLVPRVAPVHRVAQRIALDEHLLVGPVVVVRAAQQDPDAEVDVHQRRGDQFAVHHHARGDEHLAAPVLHVAVGEVARLGVLEGAPAAEQGAPQPDLLVAGQGLVEEVEQVVVHRDDLLHELDVAHQPGHVVGHQLDGRDRADPARVERGRVHVATLHEAEHLPGVAADLQRLAVELAGERVERAHDVGDGRWPCASACGAACSRPWRARRGWSRRPSSRRSRRRPGSPGRCCGRTCIRRPRRG